MPRRSLIVESRAAFGFSVVVQSGGLFFVGWALPAKIIGEIARMAGKAQPAFPNCGTTDERLDDVASLPDLDCVG